MKRIILRGGALLELDQVRHVLAVVKYRTFLEASFQLNRSQSSLSKSIRRLEEELGISIFERTTRRVELTPAGRDFVAYAEQPPGPSGGQFFQAPPQHGDRDPGIHHHAAPSGSP